MSIKVQAQVIDRYPAGGSELLLALMLAWHAADDGTRIFPSVATLARETRQSVRTVQYQLKRMQETGWLQLVGNAHGGTGRTREYRISAAWLAGTGTHGDRAEENGSQARKGSVDIGSGSPDGQLQTFDSWVEQACQANGNRRAFAEDAPVFAYCNRVGITGEMLNLHWVEFRRRNQGRSKRQRDWPEVFLRSVKNNAYRLWVSRGHGNFELTTQGVMARLDLQST